MAVILYFIGIVGLYLHLGGFYLDSCETINDVSLKIQLRVDTLYLHYLINRLILAERASPREQ
jgi:hypothetical protein